MQKVNMPLIEFSLSFKKKIAFIPLILATVLFILIIFFYKSEENYDVLHVPFSVTDEYEVVKFIAILLYLILFFITQMIGVLAIDEKSFGLGTWLWLSYLWSLNMLVQIFRIEWHEEIFEGIEISCIKWVIFIIGFTLIRYFYVRFLLKQDVKLIYFPKKKLDNKNESIIKIDGGYIVTFDDGQQIKVHQEELYPSDN